MTEAETESTHEPSPRSLACLDALNFFLADVRDGLGPYLAIYLTSRRGWDPSQVGVAMAAMLLGTIATQSPAGAMIDRIRWKRAAVAGAAGVVAAGCLAMILFQGYYVVVASQAMIGAAASVFPPAIAALTLGIVGHKRLARRTGRNEAFNHLGNVAAAVLAGAAGYLIGYWSIFCLVALMAALSVVSVLVLPESDIDHDRARGSTDGVEGGPQVESIAELFQDRRILAFTACAVMFHFANAAMLPLVGQKVTAGMDRGTAILMSACIITAQVVMIPVSLAASRLAESWGRKPVFVIGFAVLPIRGLLYTLTANPYLLVGIQLLDGIGAGIFGVVSVLVVADLTRGTGRFNLTQGVLATATALGAALSNVACGYIVKAAGFDAGFATLAAIAVGGLVLYARAMPETRDLAPHVGMKAAVAPA
ncbi:MFS transporter [Planctomyces sp. SH-PL62]|uniref:MFS transporter n=1 Tax=Planctomyces sp. SH-PL62 TaxID=1636152 RepID=UPI00078E6ADE|nr:MFS transporter [Planctomyces sp. SH-PL62]AMV37068.1 multidrug resistance protein D [Planctomyces sp. SH-PL62]